MPPHSFRIHSAFFVLVFFVLDLESHLGIGIIGIVGSIADCSTGIGILALGIGLLNWTHAPNPAKPRTTGFQRRAGPFRGTLYMKQPLVVGGWGAVRAAPKSKTER
jgi:hypothetical protein